MSPQSGLVAPADGDRTPALLVALAQCGHGPELPAGPRGGWPARSALPR